MKTVHFILEHKYYDAIERGDKKIEYRDNTPYWNKRLVGVNRATFHRGYTKTTMTFSIAVLVFTVERIAIFLGERLD